MTKAKIDDAALIQMWLTGLSANTQMAYRHEIVTFAGRLSGRPLPSTTTLDVQRYARILEAGGLAASSRYRALSALRSFFKFIVMAGVVSRNPTRALKMPKFCNELAMRVLRVEDVRRIVRAARDLIPRIPGADAEPSFRDYVLVRTLYQTGARISEVLGLRWANFSEQDAGAWVTLSGKGGKSRTVQIGAEIWALIKRLRFDSLPSGYVFRASFCESKPISREHFSRTVHYITMLAGIEAPVSPHWFRHAHASHALDAGCPIHVVKETLGHASLSSTERYLHVRPGESSSRFLPAIDKPPDGAGNVPECRAARQNRTRGIRSA